MKIAYILFYNGESYHEVLPKAYKTREKAEEEKAVLVRENQTAKAIDIIEIYFDS